MDSLEQTSLSFAFTHNQRCRRLTVFGKVKKRKDSLFKVDGNVTRVVGNTLSRLGMYHARTLKNFNFSSLQTCSHTCCIWFPRVFWRTTSRKTSLAACRFTTWHSKAMPKMRKSTNFIYIYTFSTMIDTENRFFYCSEIAEQVLSGQWHSARKREMQCPDSTWSLSFGCLISCKYKWKRSDEGKGTCWIGNSKFLLNTKHHDGTRLLCGV